MPGSAVHPGRPLRDAEAAHDGVSWSAPGGRQGWRHCLLSVIQGGHRAVCSDITIHRDERIWGPDALEFKPERWIGDARFPLEKYFLGFSYGPRACIGRNVAFMELKKTAATLFQRFNFRLVIRRSRHPSARASI